MKFEKNLSQADNHNVDFSTDLPQRGSARRDKARRIKVLVAHGKGRSISEA